MVLILKVFLERSEAEKPEIRRLAVSSDVVSSYHLLCEKILNLFPSLTGKCFVLSWRDCEDDDIVMSSDEELAQAVANGDDGLIKIFVRCVAMNDESIGARGSNVGMVHPHVVCDSCNSSIKGYRYKCLECTDYNLCSTCNALDRHQSHDMLKMATPVTYPHNWLFQGWRRMWHSMFGHRPNVSKRGATHRCTHGLKTKNCFRDEKVNPKIPENGMKTNMDFFKNFEHSMGYYFDPIDVDVKFLASQSESEPECSGGEKETNKAKANKTATKENDIKDTRILFEKLHECLKTGKMPKQRSQVNSEEDNNLDAAKEDKNVEAAKEDKAVDAAKEDKAVDAAREDKAVDAAKEEKSVDAAKEDKNVSAAKEERTSVETVPKTADKEVQQPEGVNDVGYASGPSIDPALQSPRSTSPQAELVASGITDGWTMVNPVAVPKAKEEVRYPTLPEHESIPSGGASDSATAYAPYAIPQDPQIAIALAKMSAMGFTNEGGWLTRLLQMKSGNINDVIDALYPNAGPRR